MVEDDTGACCLEHTASQHLSEFQWQVWSCASHVLYWFGTDVCTKDNLFWPIKQMELLLIVMLKFQYDQFNEFIGTTR